MDTTATAIQTNLDPPTRAWKIHLVLLAIFVVGYGLFLGKATDPRLMVGLDADRYSFMEALIERNTYIVDGSSMSSVDWIKIGNHFYSGKPPVLNFVGAGVYSVLHSTLGWSFKTHPEQLVRFHVAAYCILPILGCLVIVWLLVARGRVVEGSGPGAAWGVTLVLAFGSLLLPYGTVFTNHPLAALLLTVAFALVHPAGVYGQRQISGARLFWAGLFAALSATVDLIAGTIVGAAYMGSLLLDASGSKVRLRLDKAGLQQAATMAAGAAIPGAIHLVLNKITLGTWTIPYLVAGAFTYEGSVWLTDPKTPEYDQFPTYWSALYHYVLGHRAAVLFCPPWMWAGVLSAVVACQAKQEVLVRRGAVAVLAGLVATLVLVPKYSMGLGGSSYGPRHLVPMLPVLAPYLAIEFAAVPAVGRWLRRIGFTLACALGVVVSAVGVINVWTPHTMSAYAVLEILAERSADYGKNPFAEWVIRTTAPNVSFGYAEFGHALWERKKLRDAAWAYGVSVKHDPDRVQSLYCLGTICGQLESHQQAMQAFRRITEIEPTNAGAWSNLGQSYLRLGDARSARPALERGLELNPRSNAALSGLLMLAEAEGRTSDVLELRRRVMNRDKPTSGGL